MTENDVQCKACDWIGKRNVLMTHLRTKPDCKSKYDLKSLDAENEQLKKLKKQEYNKSQYKKKSEEIKAKSKQYYEMHKDKEQAQKRKHYEINKEEKKEYYEENRKERIEYQKQYYQDNKEERKEYQRKYDEDHKNKKKEYKQLLAHYKKLNDNGLTENFFLLKGMKEFRIHVKGMCNWSEGETCHEYRWDIVDDKCWKCRETLFRFISKTSTNKPFKLNALHCIVCGNATCDICSLYIEIEKDQYYTHFYVDGVNSHLKEVGELCPYKTYLNVEDDKIMNFPCEICNNEEIQEKSKQFTQEIGKTYRNFIDEQTMETVSIKRSLGTNLVCPYTGQDKTSAVSLTGAVIKLAENINDGIESNHPDYIQLNEEINFDFHTRTKFNHACQLKKNMDLHETRQIETHLIELGLKESYKDQKDLQIIEKLLKIKIESHSQVYRIGQIAPAERCLGFFIKSTWLRTNNGAWLVFCNPNDISEPITREKCDYLNDRLDITDRMTKMKEEKKLLYIVVLTLERNLANAIAFFENATTYPDWVDTSKLLFTWSVKMIMEEKDKKMQKSLIESDFIQSKIHPGYFMNIRFAGLSSDVDGIYDMMHTKPVRGCQLPVRRSLLDAENDSLTKSNRMYWERMFNFAWRSIQAYNESDTSISSETDSDSNIDSQESNNDSDSKTDSQESNNDSDSKIDSQESNNDSDSNIDSQDSNNGDNELWDHTMWV